MESRPCLWMCWQLCPLSLDCSRVHLAACIPTKNSRDDRFPSGVACYVTARPLTSLGLPWQRDLS